MADYLASRGNNPVFNGFTGRTRHLAERDRAAEPREPRLACRRDRAGRLDALVREHLDLCSHRLDAWQLGEAVRRLGTMRAKTPGGVFLGAYGWVENLRPKPELPIAEALPPALHRDGEPAVFADPTNEGFVHTPSVSHAVTAAILRSAYLTETNEPDVENAMAINLSSRRVRLALDLLDGVEAGNDLGALLGYQLERELHEAFATEHVSFDALIFELRRHYPGKAGVDPAISNSRHGASPGRRRAQPSQCGAAMGRGERAACGAARPQPLRDPRRQRHGDAAAPRRRARRPTPERHVPGARQSCRRPRCNR